VCEEGFKRCSKCGEIKPISEFNKDISRKDGCASSCKACKKLYRLENKERISEYRKEYYPRYRLEHEKELSEYKKEYYKTNKASILQKNRKYYVENRASILESNKDYYEKNREHTLEVAKRYRNENKERCAERCKERYEKNREHYLEYKKAWGRTVEGIESYKRHAHKRRGFGFSPINNYFEGAEFHHMHVDFNGDEDHEIGIFVPGDLHRSIKHNSFTWAGMEEMNNKAIEWYNENYNVVNYIDKCNSHRSLLDFY